MKHKDSLSFVQRFALVELESILFMVIIHVLFSLFSFSELQFTEVTWLQLLFVIMAYPLYYFSSKNGISIWLAITTTVSLVIGYKLGVDAPWLPVVLTIWRSISLANEQEYLAATYNRMISMILLLIVYFSISNLYNQPVWWAIPYLTAGSILFTVIGMACNNLLEQLSWNPNPEEWKRIGRNQFIFATGMMVLVVCLVIIRNQFIFLYTQVVALALKTIAFLLAPIIYLLSKVISLFYELLLGGDGKAIKSMGRMSEFLLMAKVKDTDPGENWIWSLITVVLVVCLFFLLVKMIRKIFRNSRQNHEEGEWTEIIELSETNQQNSLFSFIRNLNPFRKRQDLDQVRLHYMEFLKQYNKLTNRYPTNPTTRDMMKVASKELTVNEEELHLLTKIYEEHRYGGKPADATAVQRMKNAVGNWLRGTQ
ncbi:DUF4129 domain-containing protein [Pseudoneobacillus sp. C159]